MARASKTPTVPISASAQLRHPITALCVSIDTRARTIPVRQRINTVFSYKVKTMRVYRTKIESECVSF